jgi:predicted DsbA family dithiol-disulfide isomerase
MNPTLQISFVSDIACPWCAIGLNSLEKALDALQGSVDVQLQFEPFELNPDMPAEGANAAAYLSRKYGMSAEQVAQAQARLRERGTAVGFEFGVRSQVWNTFDAHRLLRWAGLQGRQRELKHALLRAYHTEGRNPGDPQVLAELATAVGLDGERALAIVAGDEFAAEVRERERHWQRLGIQAVPAVVVQGKHLIQGGQPPEVFEQALREIAAAA